MRRTSAVALLACVAVTAVACKRDGTSSPVPTTVTITPGSVTLVSLNATAALTVTVRDQNGNVMSGIGVTWTSDNGAIAQVSPGGVVTAISNGNTTVRAAAGSVQGTATVTVAQAVAALVKSQGDAQTGTVGSALATALIVRANDALGSAVAGVAVTLSVTTGGGSLAGSAGTTGSNGLTAPVTWTLGTTAGAQQVTASATGTPNAVFSATATAAAPASVVIQAGDGQTGPAGVAVPVRPAVLVRDQFNNPVSGAAVGFVVAAGGGSVTGGTTTTGSNGIATVGSWVLGTAGQPQQLTATVTGGGITGNPITFNATSTAAGSPASIAVFAGNNQTGLVGFALNVPPAVIVRDNASAPVPNVTVDFAVASGGGNVTGASVVTGSNGVAQVGSWVIGAVAGANTLTATAQAAGVSGNPVTFDATGITAAFNIDVRFLTAVTPAQQAAFDSAEVRWERMLYGELPDISINIGAGPCAGVSIPAVNETVDDLIIFVRLDSIDGPLNQLGSAGPCRIRINIADTTPIIGAMRFDTADVARFLTQGLFDEIVMHEMGHVLGYGTLWPLLNRLANPSQSGGADPHFTGPEAIAAFDANGGSGYSAGQKVPVENTGGPGTADGHWRESVFDRELMTGFLDGGVANPMSVISLASMADIEYRRVNYAAADPYVVTNPLGLRVASAGVSIPFGNDIAWGPLILVDPAGRVRGTWVPPW